MMARPARLATAWAAAALAAMPVWQGACAAEPQAAPAPASASAPAPAPAIVALIVHYNERVPHHYTERGVPTGPAIARVAEALSAARITYKLRSTPAKQQLIILQANAAPACMLAWVDLPGRDSKGKLSEKVYDERRLWCTKATPDETMQRIDAALRNAALPK